MMDCGVSGDEIDKEDHLVKANESSPSSSKESDSDDEWHPPALSSHQFDCFDPIGTTAPTDTGTMTATPRIVSQYSSMRNNRYPGMQDAAPEQAVIPFKIESMAATETDNVAALESCNIKEEEMNGARLSMSQPMVFQVGENVWVKSGNKDMEYEAQVMSNDYKYDGDVAYMQIKWAVRGTTEDVKVSDVSLLFQADDLDRNTKRSSRRKPKQTKRFEPSVDTKVKRAPNKNMKQVKKRKNTVKTKTNQSQKGKLQSKKTKSQKREDVNVTPTVMSQQLTSDNSLGVNDILQNDIVPHGKMGRFQESPSADVQDEASEEDVRARIGIKDEGVQETVPGMSKKDCFQKGDHVHVKNGNRGIEYHATVLSGEITYFPQNDDGKKDSISEEPYIEIQWDVQRSKAFVKVSDTSLVLDVDDLNAESVSSGNVRRSRRIPKQTNRFQPITDASKKIKKRGSTKESHLEKDKKPTKEKLVEHTYINILWKRNEIQEAHQESDEESLATVKMPDTYLLQSNSVYEDGLCDDVSVDLNESMMDNDAPTSRSPGGGGTIDSFFHSTPRKFGTSIRPDAKRRPIVAQSQTRRRSKKRNPMAKSPGLEQYFSSEKKKVSKRSIWNNTPSDTQHTPELPPTKNLQQSIEEHSVGESSSDEFSWGEMKKARSTSKSQRLSDYYASSPKKALSQSDSKQSTRTNVHESQNAEDFATDSFVPTSAFPTESHTTTSPPYTTISSGKETVHETNNATHSHDPNSLPTTVHENENGRKGDTTDQLLSAPQKQTDHLSVDTAHILSNVVTRLDDSDSNNGTTTQTSESQRQTVDYSSNVCDLLYEVPTETQHTAKLHQTNHERSIKRSTTEESSPSSSDDSLQWEEMKKARSTNKSQRFSDYYVSSPKKAPLQSHSHSVRTNVHESQNVQDCAADALNESEDGEGVTTNPLSAPQKQTDDASVDTAHVLCDVVTGLDYSDLNGTPTQTSKSRRETADSLNVRNLVLDLDSDLLLETTHPHGGEPDTAVVEPPQDANQVATNDDSSCGTVELLSLYGTNRRSTLAAEDGDICPLEIDLTQIDDDDDSEDTPDSVSPPPRRRKRSALKSFRSHVVLNLEEQDVICLLDEDSD